MRNIRHNQPRSAFTLFEAVITLLVVAVLSTITYTGISKVQERASDRALATQMDAVRAAGRTVAAQNGAKFPEDIHLRLPLNGLAASIGPSTQTTEVSVGYISDTRVGYAIVDGRGGCIGVWDDLERTGVSSVIWLRDPETSLGNCLGRSITAQDDRISALDNHEYDNPGPIDFDAGYPDQVQNLTVVQSSPTAVELSWDMPTGPSTDQIRIYRAILDPQAPVETEPDYGEVAYAEINVTGSDLPPNSFQDMSFPYAANISYKVVARGRVLQLDSPASDPAGILTRPPKPLSIDASPEQDHTQVTFAPVTGSPEPIITKYIVRVGGSVVREFAPTDTFAYRHDDESIVAWEENTSFTYAVEACNESGCGPANFIDQVSALEPPVPSAVSGPNYVAISWPEVAGAVGYSISRSTTSTAEAGWFGPIGDSVDVTTSPAIAGARSLSVTARSVAGAAPGKVQAQYGSGVNGVPVTATKNYSFTFTARSESPGALGARAVLRWYDSAGVNISDSYGPVRTIGAADVQVSYSAVAPVQAVSVALNADFSGAQHTSPRSKFILDSISLKEAGSSVNLLSTASADFETNGTEDTQLATISSDYEPFWVETNSTLTRNAAGYGVITPAGAGAVSASSTPWSSGVAVNDLSDYTGSIQVKTASGTRSVKAQLSFYSANGQVLATREQTATASTSWSTINLSQIASPKDARRVNLIVSYSALNAGSVVHIDNAKIVSGGANLLNDLGASFSDRGYVDYSVPAGVAADYEIVSLSDDGSRSRPGLAAGSPDSQPNSTNLRSAVSDIQSVHVTWWPTNDPTTPAEGWQVWYSDGTDWKFGCSAAGGSDNCTVPNLIPAQTYYFVAVPYANGSYGPASNTLSAVPKGKSTPPRSPGLAGYKYDRGVVASWVYPSSDYGLPIQQWEVKTAGHVSSQIINSPRPVPWVAYRGTVPQQSTERAMSGSGSYRFVNDGSHSNSGMYFQGTSYGMFPAEDSKAVSYSACVYSQGAANTLRLQINSYTRSGVQNQSSNYYDDWNIPANTWSCRTLSTTLPFDVYTMIPFIIMLNQVNGDVTFVDDISLKIGGGERMSSYLRNGERLGVVIPNIANGTSVSMNVRAYNGFLWSDRAYSSTNRTPSHYLSIPPKPSINASSSTTSSVSMTASGKSGTQRYRFATSGGTLLSGPTTSSSYTQTGRGANTNYCYEVRTQNGAGLSAISSHSCRYTLPLAPVFSGTVSMTTSSIYMSWSKPSGAGSISRYHMTKGSSATSSYFDTGTSRVKNHTGLPACTTKSYRVRALGPGGWSAWSGTTQRRTKCATQTVFVSPGGAGWEDSYKEAGGWSIGSDQKGEYGWFPGSAGNAHWSTGFLWSNAERQSWYNGLGSYKQITGCTVRVVATDHWYSGRTARMKFHGTGVGSLANSRPTFYGQQWANGGSSNGATYVTTNADFGGGCVRWVSGSKNHGVLIGAVLNTAADSTYSYTGRVYGGLFSTSAWRPRLSLYAEY